MRACLLLLPLLMMPPATAQVADTAEDFGYRFVRIKYDDNRGARGRWGGGGSWAYDYPTAEQNLHEAIERTTNIHLTGRPIVLELTDERIFEHPVLYLCEPGWWADTDEEIENLRRYFAQGGFMIIDDFHDYGSGGPQWDNFYRIMKAVFPDKEPVPLPPEHPVWSIYFDIDPIEAASTKDYEGFTKHDDEYYAIFDDDGRMMVIICYKQDIGDGWEWPNRNFEEASTVSFQMAVNFIMYALTH